MLKLAVAALLSTSLLVPSLRAEKVLLPILSKPAPGALGSRWETEVRMLVASEGELDVFPLLDCWLCEVPRNVAFDPPLWFQQPSHPPGAVIYLQGDAADDVFFSLRVRDVSHSGDRGTEIPVIRENELFTRSLHLPDVPIEPGFRQTLRVYDADAKPGAAVRIRIFGEGTQPLVDISTPFHFSPAHNPNLQQNVTPGYIQLNRLSDTYPALAAEDRVRIVIDPLTAGLRFWAFATLTSDATQHLTLVTPQ